MNQPTVLCLDLGTKTGYALLTSTGHIESGTLNLQPDRFSGGGMRFLKFNHWLNQTLSHGQTLDAIYFEAARRHLGTDAAHTYGAFWGQLSAWCEHHQIPYQGIPVGTIKKTLTGKGNASKQHVIAAIQKKGHDPKDDNEADALAILYTVLSSNLPGDRL